jgi:hypothetical protein
MVESLTNEMSVSMQVTSPLVTFYRDARCVADVHPFCFDELVRRSKRKFGATDIANEAFNKRARAADDDSAYAVNARVFVRDGRLARSVLDTSVAQDAAFIVDYNVPYVCMCARVTLCSCGASCRQVLAMLPPPDNLPSDLLADIVGGGGDCVCVHKLIVFTGDCIYEQFATAASEFAKCAW